MTMMTPIEAVQLQFEAYNERNLPRFLSAFAEDISSFRLPDMTPVLSGKAAYGEFYARERFNHAGLRAELVNRVALGDTVIDHELIHGLAPEPIETAIMFVIRDGLIAKVFAIPGK